MKTWRPWCHSDSHGHGGGSDDGPKETSRLALWPNCDATEVGHRAIPQARSEDRPTVADEDVEIFQADLTLAPVVLTGAGGEIRPPAVSRAK